jgi:hypothetical protein
MKLRETDNSASLKSFMTQYVALAPDLVTAFEDFVEVTGIGNQLALQVLTARKFADDIPKRLSPTSDQFAAQVQQAYSVHQLLHGINELLTTECGCEVVPVDMTRSNQLMGEIIGEPFASELQEAAKLLKNQLLDSIREDLTIRKKIDDYLGNLPESVPHQFPCLNKFESIRRLYKSQNNKMRLQ